MNNPKAIIMVRPANFGFNAETAESNKFQNSESPNNVNELALNEFDLMVDTLIAGGLDVRVLHDTDEPIKPDAIFPNNWISFHHGGKSVLYPMEANNRRLERRLDVFDLANTYDKNALVDFSEYENSGKYLEGTGSIIFDHAHKKAYCAQSSRSDIAVFERLCAELKFQPISFEARDVNGFPIYHTNVLLSIGDHVVVFCAECVENPIERAMVLNSLHESAKKIVEVSFSQMSNFAANCLEVNDVVGIPKLIMSQTAYNSLAKTQIEEIQSLVEIIPVNIATIEKIGGGSARCMLLGVY